MDDYKILKFASLFHDIGKFYQRSHNMSNGKTSYDSKYSKLNKESYGDNDYSKWSADFVSKYFNNQVENLVLHHNSPENSDYVKLCEILQKADQHSSKEKSKSIDLNEELNTPLTSIFSRIFIDSKKNEEYYVPLIPLDFFNDDRLYPKKVNNKECLNLDDKYEKLWVQFIHEFDKLNNKDFETSLAIIKKYTSTMPSVAYKDESDISLYDHLKTTVAIANCRYLYSKDNKLEQNDTQKVYKIIMGDISGIQNFIYKIKTPEDAQKGMSKRLRGRSLYLSLLCESIASKIIFDLNLDSSNILFCGGGKFTIIAPNISISNEVLKNIEFDINQLFIDNFNSELFLNLVSCDVCGENLGKFDEVLFELNQLLNENKKHKFINQLHEVFKIDSKDNYNVTPVSDSLTNYKLCPVCGNLTNNGDFCEDCSEHENLGGVVANAKYLIKYYSNKKLEKSFFFNKLGIGYFFVNTKYDVLNIVEENQNIKFHVFKLNNADFLDIDIDRPNVSFDFKVIGNNIPKIDNTPLYFNHLAEISNGANKLGVLKMDVDNLGLIFSNGLKHLNNDGEVSISRISSLSFYLDLFFSGCINQIVEKFFFITNPLDCIKCEKNELNFIGMENDKKESKIIYKPQDVLQSGIGTSTIHINYSGGDDLLVVGPYDDIIEFALEFRNKFKDWTAHNDSITISAGISIVSPKFPIGKAALLADAELEKSKECGRDKISVFGEVLSWESGNNISGYDNLLEFGKYLEELYNKNHISKGFIYSLLKIWQSRAEVEPLYRFNPRSWVDKNVEKIHKRRYIPIFKYKLRLIEDDSIREELDKKGLKYMPWIKTPVSWASLRLR